MILRYIQGPFLAALVGELVNEENPPMNRQLAGLYLKNVITAQDEHILEQKEERWAKCDEGNKETVLNGVSYCQISKSFSKFTLLACLV